ncbi:MAG TPA: fused MFS/spermidine synthase [Myxococcales bacterium]|nr:fused MFS/spermidine synthase [Myxococcales bacterium]
MRKEVRLRSVQALFVVSGAAGLIYEVVWSRLLKEVFGVTAYAVAAVLATYLAGLALGAWLLGRRADREPDPLRFYGLLELAVGASAVVGALLLRFLGPLHDAAAVRLAPGSPLLLLIRLLLASLVVLPPTFLMGATLPAITRVFVGGLGSVGRDLGALYALNTAGAVGGSLLAGFFLIRDLGVHRTLWVAVATNLAVGFVALALAARGAPEAAPAPESPAHGGPVDKGLLVAVGLSGVVTLALEVLWTRVLVLVVGSSTHAFVTMLSAFLVGIALGSALVRLFAARLADPRRAFGWVQAGIAVSTLATVPLMNLLVARAQQWMFELEGRWMALGLGRFGVAFLIMLVPTTLIGMVFPLAGAIGVRRLRALGGELGSVYAALTAGNIAGALLAVFVLLPAAGMQRGVVLVSAASVASAAWAFLPAFRDRRLWRRTVPAVAAAALWAGILVFWQPRPFVSIEEGPADPVRFYQEGLVSTVKVLQRATDGRQLVMLVDGIRIGQSSAGIDNKQQVLAHFPFLLRPGDPPAHVLSIGLGTGILAGEVARHPGVEAVECVELSPSVIEGAKKFSAYSFDVLHDRRVKVIEDDGISFLRRSPSRYDAIISDGKSRLGQAGNALFYASEYYESARRHLAPRGLMIQWMPLEEVAADLRIIVRTFMAVFPHAYLFLAHDSAFLVGMEEPLTFDLPALQRELDAPAVADLRRYGWRDATEVVSLLVADRASAAAWLGQEETLNSQERPVLEFYSPKELATPAARRLGANAAALASVREGALRGTRVTGADPGTLQTRMRSLATLLSALDLNGRAAPQKDVAALLEKAADDAVPGGVIRSWVAASLLSMGVQAEEQGEPSRAFWLYRGAAEAWPESVPAHLQLGRSWAMQGQVRDAVVEFRKALQLNPESATGHRDLARLLREIGDPYQAIQHYLEAVRIAPGDAEAHADLGQCLAMASRHDEALAQFRAAMEILPRWPPPMAFAAMLLATHPNPASRRPEEAVALARRAAGLTDWKDRGVLEILAAAFASAGRFEEAVDAERKALALVPPNAEPRMVSEMEAALDLYQRGLTRR